MSGGQMFQEQATFRTVDTFASQANIQVTEAPEPFTILGSMAALGFGVRLKRKRDRQKVA